MIVDLKLPIFPSSSLVQQHLDHLERAGFIDPIIRTADHPESDFLAPDEPAEKVISQRWQPHNRKHDIFETLSLPNFIGERNYYLPRSWLSRVAH